MGMKIENSLDWNLVCHKLEKQLSDIPYNQELHKMLSNISKMVDELSKIEVLARRTYKSNLTLEKVEAINKAIDHLEKLIVMANLMK